MVNWLRVYENDDAYTNLLYIMATTIVHAIKTIKTPIATPIAGALEVPSIISLRSCKIFQIF